MIYSQGLEGILCIDFGASRVKAVLHVKGEFFSPMDYAPVAPCRMDSHYFEVSPSSLISLFEFIVQKYSKEYILKGILLCSEMHGFILQNDAGDFIGNYISWQDNRANEIVDGESTFEFIKKRLPNFKQHTGMSIRCGLPAINLLHLLRTGDLSQGNYRVLSLPEIFGASHIHTTLLAGLGIWDIYKNMFYRDLMNLYKEFGLSISTNIPCSQILKTGQFRGIPIYTALGDNQTALLGTSLKNEQVILNLGTGSQIAYIDDFRQNINLDQRPYFDGKALSLLSHIPSGRALNCFMGILEECIKWAKGTKNSWDLLMDISLEEIKHSTMTFDLAVFESAHGFVQGGKIIGIMEKEFSIRSYLASLLRSYIDQYLKIIDDYDVPTKNILLSGGIPKKLPVVRQYLADSLNQTIFLSESSIDETLEGLKIIISKCKLSEGAKV